MLDFGLYDYRSHHLRTAAQSYKKQIVYFVVDHINKYQDVAALEGLVSTQNVSLIMDKLPERLAKMS